MATDKRCVRRGSSFWLAALLIGNSATEVVARDPPNLRTNEAYVSEVTRPTTLAVEDPPAVFAYVFERLPAEVKVYPTENYYYFGFVHNGVPYAGNIRLDASTRDEGKVDFAYYADTAPWNEDSPVKYLLLDATHGVSLEKVERLVYRLSFKGKTVTFALNDLSAVKPTALDPDERYIGPVFDESATRFFLVFNAKLKLFHYVLDESQPADGLVPLRRASRISVGARTGFAYYRDHRLERKILIGVFEGNVRANNYFDGPFDQLPDNFIEGEALREAILAVDPGLKGKINRLGLDPNGATRFVIAPYLIYRETDDLLQLERCAAARRGKADYARCFVTDNAPQPPAGPRRKRKGT